MPTAKPSSVTDPALALEATTMAIREHLMLYFKGSCVEQLTTNTGVTTTNLSDFIGRGTFYSDRREAANKNSKLLFIHTVPILTMQTNSDTCILHNQTLDRSKELRAIKQSLKVFMAEYLAGVKVHENKGGIFYAHWL